VGLFSSDFSLNDFIRSANDHGLPTSFLKVVQSEFILSSSGEGGDDMVQPVLKRLSLSQGTLSSVKNMSLDVPLGESVGIQTIYHEGTHAFIALKKSQPEVSTLLRSGRSHYKQGLLADRTKASDEDRIVQEALGEYVGHRASAFRSTGEAMFASQRAQSAGKASGKAFWDYFREIPKKYDRAMGLRVFGYQTKGLLWKSRQVETSTPIPGRLKEFCDRVILENAIPEQFSRVKRFADPYRAICKSVPGFYCPF